jgi:hypothetical protein
LRVHIGILVPCAGWCVLPSSLVSGVAPNVWAFPGELGLESPERPVACGSADRKKRQDGGVVSCLSCGMKLLFPLSLALRSGDLICTRTWGAPGMAGIVVLCTH